MLALVRWGGRWMLQGPGDDVFRAHWLALALDALGSGAGLEGVVVELVVAGEQVMLTGQHGRVVALDPAGHTAQMRITADPATVLGLAAGAVTQAQARVGLDVEPDDEGSRQLAITALSG